MEGAVLEILITMATMQLAQIGILAGIFYRLGNHSGRLTNLERKEA